MKKIEHLAWLTGAYVMHSIGASFSKKIKYPDSPLSEKQVVVEDMELTEEEKEAGLQNLMAKLQGMADKFKKNKEENESN